MRLSDTVIVVTGASKGLGRRMAEAFVDAGATVVGTARSTGGLDELVDHSGSKPGEAIAVRCDVRTRSDVESLFRTTDERAGRLDVLVNNAGVSEKHLTGRADVPLVELPVDAWDTVIETNLRGAFLCSREAMPRLRESGGRAIHLTSGMGQEGRARRGAYVASKFGLEGLHQSIADELDGSGASSVLLEPGGGVDTEGFSSHLDESERTGRLDPSVIVEPALKLAEGYGTNGGRYVATEMDTSG